MSDNPISKEAIVIERTFDAPVDLIWKMWTEPEHFKHWYGPQGFSVPVINMDVRVGGKRLICMETPDGSMKMWTTGEYTEIIPHQRLVYTDCPADENGNLVPLPNTGQTLVTTVTVELEDLDGRTKMTMTHAGLPAGEGTQGANEGWNQSITRMADYVDSIVNNK